jgi:hypothetical protein
MVSAMTASATGDTLTVNVESPQSLAASGHVREAAQPDGAVRIVYVAESPEHSQPDGLLRLDELALDPRRPRGARSGATRGPRNRLCLCRVHWPQQGIVGIRSWVRKRPK